jgi:hypothetical protein
VRHRRLLHWSIAVAVGAIYYACNPNFLYYDIVGGPGIALHEQLGLDRLPYAWIHDCDYTFRTASALTQGRLGINEKPPGWLNEFIPRNGTYYSAFPLGSVLSVWPGALLKQAGVFANYPAALTAALVAAVIAWQLCALGFAYGMSLAKCAWLALAFTLGTFMWCNLAMAGAWQLALGLAMIGELGALQYSIIRPRAFFCGSFFALAFGNRTEVLLLAPLFVLLLCRRATPPCWKQILRFGIVPLALGLLTFAYNYARFGAITEFGHALIPGVLTEPWYRHGIFSLHAIPLNFREMLLVTWKKIETHPHLVPTGFGGSIFLNCPLLLMIFQAGRRDRTIKIFSWIAIVVLTAVLWTHGNPGGWQFSYRYAMLLLPWMFLLMLESGGRTISRVEVALIVASVAINTYATYLFLWTDYLKP